MACLEDVAADKVADDAWHSRDRVANPCTRASMTCDTTILLVHDQMTTKNITSYYLDDLYGSTSCEYGTSR